MPDSTAGRAGRTVRTHEGSSNTGSKFHSVAERRTQEGEPRKATGNLVVEDNLKQRIVYSDSFAVLNVPKFPEAIEEEADPRPRAPTHLG